MATYAERGIQRRLVHGHGAGGMFPEPQRWLYQAQGPWRDTEAQVVADLALFDAEVLETLRILVFLATEATDGDPNPEEAAAILVGMALVDVLDVAAG